MRRRVVLLCALTSLFIVLAAAPASAKGGGGGGNHDRRISLNGALVVATGEVVNGPIVSVDGPATIAGRVNDDVFVGRGDLTISGRVTGDVLVVDGDATVTGRVDGDITALHGRISVSAGASVHGDITSSTTPRAAPGTFRGHVKTLDVTSIFTGFVVAFLIFLWLAVTVSIGILGLFFVVVFPRAADAAVVAGRRVAASIAVGLLVGILGPILGVAIVTSIVGIPLGVGLLAAMIVLAPLGSGDSSSEVPDPGLASVRSSPGSRSCVSRHSSLDSASSSGISPASTGWAHSRSRRGPPVIATTHRRRRWHPPPRRPRRRSRRPRRGAQPRTAPA
jgi:cytoskeletal protein CcmA (bactofilin family)